ncbi:transmembrane protein, putative, partial [Bodo saltans]
MFDAAKFRRQRRIRVMLDTNVTSCVTVGCGDHGTCVSNVGCVCDQDSTKGYWQRSDKDNGRCTMCMVGFAGSNCLLECQGGSCNICNGNGACSQDVTGDGTCTCYRNATTGFWSGSSCSTCASGYFGAKCQNYCPGVDKGTPCGGRGECKTDSNGNGACVCNVGYGADSGCESCDLAHYSVSCSLTCPGYVTSGNTMGQACSGHGKCFNGTSGNGTCVCDPYYGLEDCSKKCLNSCSGHGICSEGSTGTGQCSCDDRYAPPDCGSCIANRTGIECEIDCSVNSDLEVCNNQGACNYTMKVSVYAKPYYPRNASRTLSTFTREVHSKTATASATYRSFCTCAPGYTGAECEVACPGDPPCNGHGTCNLVGGVSRCTCFQNNDTGYWTGDTCSTCSVAYNNSVNCNVLCPVSGGVICSGHGYCAEGYCYCERRDPDSGLDYCDTACQQSSLPSTSDTGQCSKCGCLLCTTEFQFGPTCRSTCPGTANGITCSGNGVCSEGKTANGTCLCYFGYAGTDCSVSCAFSILNGLPCSGFDRGICQCSAASTSTCVPVCSCRDGFAGSSCERTCPIVNGLTCSGHGTCEPTTAGCLCDSEYTGMACNVPCGCNTENGVCDAVTCYNYPASSVCNVCNCFGNFTGVCNLCKAGTQGLTCGGACVHGTTSLVSKECICEPNWSTASCTVACPVGTNGHICGGNGTCASGNRFSGLCACNASMYGSTCEVFCSLDYCQSRFGMLHPQCNLVTGACECRTDTSGYWSGATCSDCVYGYWGTSCTEACDCSNHGSCDSVQCYCSQDETDGFFTGTTCDTCSTGYIGASCNIKDVAITRITRNVNGVSGSILVAANATFNNPTLHSPVTTVAAVDEYNNAKTLFVGARPVVQFDTSQGTLEFIRTTSGNNIFSNSTCYSTSPGDAAYVFVDKQYAYFLMQPLMAQFDGCTLPIRLVVVDRQTLALVATFPLNTTTVNNTNEDSFNATVRVTAADAQYDTGDTETAIKARLTFLVAQTTLDSTTSFLAPFPGGWVVHVDVEELMNKQSRTIVSYQLPKNFLANDVALSPYTLDTFSVVAIAGFYVSAGDPVWDVLAVYVFQGNHSFSPAFNGQISIKSSAPCWMLVTGGVDPGACTLCARAERVLWVNNDLLVAMSSTLSNTDTIIVWIRRVQDMDPGSSVYATTTSTGTTCATLTLRSDLVSGLSLVGNSSRTLSSCSTANCPEALFNIEQTQAGTATSQATAIIYDSFTNVSYIALRVNAGNSASVIAKCSVVEGSFAVYGLKTLGFVTNSLGRSKPEVILAMAIAKNARMLFAPVSGVQSLSVVTILLYEIRSIAPDIADQRNNTLITLYGSGYSRVNLPGDGVTTTYSVNCQFGSAFTPATIVSSTQITCYAPTESETSSAQSCGQQSLEVSMYNQSFPTANGLYIQRAQSAMLTSVSPVRGAMVSANKQVINITGTGFQDSTFSLCKFYSNSSLSRQTLYSPVTLITPNLIQCTQPNATEPSYDTALLDVSIDGQLYTIDGPIVYEIVGSPAGIQNYPSNITVPAAQQTNFTFTTYIVDIRQHRLENLDLEERTFYLFLNISYDSDCSTTSWRPEKNCVPGLELFNASYPNASTSGSIHSLYNAVPCHNESLNNVPSDPRVPWGDEGPTAFPVGYTDNNSRLMYDGVKVFVRRIPVLQGKVEFTDLFFVAPRAGQVTLTVTIPDSSWSATTSIVVVPGDPFALAIDNMADFQSYTSTLQSPNCSTSLESKFFIKANTRLAPIELVVVDRMANIVTIEFNQYTLNSNYYYVQDYDLVQKDQAQSIPTPTQRDNKFIYSDIILFEVHGVSHYVKFSAVDRTSGAVYNTTTPAIRTQSCASSDYYKVPLESTCLPCPGVGSVCDGSELIVVEPGYWRANGSSTHIYLCPGGPTNLFRKLFRPLSYCAPGHTGPLCANCIDGYGKSGTDCIKCDDMSVTATIVAFVVLLVFILLIIWTIVTLRNAETTDLSVIMRTVVNHMQATGELGAFSSQWGPFMQSFMSGQSTASGGGLSVNGVQAFDCLLRGYGQDYRTIFAGYMCLPGIAFGLALVVFGVVRGLKLVPVITPELSREIDEDVKNFGANARTAIIKVRYPMYMVVVTTNCVIMFTLYQTIITQCANALQCATFVFNDHDGVIVSQSYLQSDYSILCGGGNSPLTTPALIFAALYGLGIPLAFTAGYLFVNDTVNMPQLTKLMFMFLCGGYKEQYFFCQNLI